MIPAAIIKGQALWAAEMEHGDGSVPWWEMGEWLGGFCTFYMKFRPQKQSVLCVNLILKMFFSFIVKLPNCLALETAEGHWVLLKEWII